MPTILKEIKQNYFRRELESTQKKTKLKSKLIKIKNSIDELNNKVDIPGGKLEQREKNRKVFENLMAEIFPQIPETLQILSSTNTHKKTHM